MAAQISNIAREIAGRRAQSGLGVGCAEAQADGLPCDDPAGDCDHCAKAGEAAKATVPPRVVGVKQTPGTR